MVVIAVRSWDCRVAAVDSSSAAAAAVGMGHEQAERVRYIITIDKKCIRDDIVYHTTHERPAGPISFSLLLFCL